MVPWFDYDDGVAGADVEGGHTVPSGWPGHCAQSARRIADGLNSPELVATIR